MLKSPDDGVNALSQGLYDSRECTEELSFADTLGFLVENDDNGIRVFNFHCKTVNWDIGPGENFVTDCRFDIECYTTI